MQRTRVGFRFRFGLVLLAAALLAAACGDSDSDGEVGADLGGEVADDFELVDDELVCGDDIVEGAPDLRIVVAYVVVEGELGDRCFGDDDPRLSRAWGDLAAIAPAGQRADLAVFAGFIADESGEEETLAYVNILDDAGTVFQMSVNLDSVESDPDESMLTMAHEFAHVFAGLSTEVDRFADPDSCDTYWNGEGCYLPDSLMFRWILEFWGDGLIEQIDPDSEATAADGEERCAVHPGFFGSYAASNPEEDFAEAFSAYVFQLEPDHPDQQDRLDWIDAQPGLAEFRDRAVDAGLGPLRNNFDLCG